VIRVASRASPLARAQVHEVLSLFELLYPELVFDTLFVETTGDKDQTTSLKTLEKSDFFTKEIDQLLLQGACRLALHSAKDLPDPLPEGLALVALTRGVSSADVLVLRSGETLETLKRGALIGTSSLRREQQIAALRSDLCCIDIRGTIEVRLAKLDSGVIDGLVMAEAALIRLGLTDRNRLTLEEESAPRQGRLALIARTDDLEMKKLCSALDARQKRVLYLGTDPSGYVTEGTLVHHPLIHITPRSVHLPEIALAYAQMPLYTHLLLTSKNAAGLLFAYHSVQALAEKEICAIGKATAAEIEKRGLRVKWVAEEETQEGMIAQLKKEALDSAYLFYPRSSRARPQLKNFLESLNIRHRVCDIYDTSTNSALPFLPLEEFDELVFTSPSTVEAFFERYAQIPPGVTIKAIGPVTLAALKRKRDQALCLLQNQPSVCLSQCSKE
jgi:hydroxymethylbilane synthase